MSGRGNTPGQDLMTLIGALGEMAHTFYTGMIGAGADRQEATAGMQGFIMAWWADAMNNARRENQEDEQD